MSQFGIKPAIRKNGMSSITYYVLRAKEGKQNVER